MARRIEDRYADLGELAEDLQRNLRSGLEAALGRLNLVTREEFDAVRAMAQKAREENEALKARIEALEAAQSGAKS